MRTVRDFKNFVLAQVGAEDGRNFMRGQWKLRQRNPLGSELKRTIFWDRLNRLGWQRMTIKWGEGDIDATALLTDDEWQKLETELHAHLE